MTCPDQVIWLFLFLLSLWPQLLYAYNPHNSINSNQYHYFCLPMWAGEPSLCSGPQHKWLCPLKFHRKWTPNILCLFLILDPNILFFSLLGLFSFCFNYHYLKRCWFFSIALEKYMYVCLYRYRDHICV